MPLATLNCKSFASPTSRIWLCAKWRSALLSPLNNHLSDEVKSHTDRNWKGSGSAHNVQVWRMKGRWEVQTSPWDTFHKGCKDLCQLDTVAHAMSPNQECPLYSQRHLSLWWPWTSWLILKSQERKQISFICRDDCRKPTFHGLIHQTPDSGEI